MIYLLIFCGFPNDPQSVLAAVQGLALMTREKRINLPFCRFFFEFGRLKLCVAAFAHGMNETRSPSYHAQFALRHDCSLAHMAGRA